MGTDHSLCRFVWTALDFLCCNSNPALDFPVKPWRLNCWRHRGIGCLSAEMNFPPLSEPYLSEKWATECKKSLILRVVVTRVASHFGEVYLRHIFMCFSLLALVTGLTGISAPDPAATDPQWFQIASGNLHHIAGSSCSSLETLGFITALSGSGTLTSAQFSRSTRSDQEF